MVLDCARKGQARVGVVYVLCTALDVAGEVMYVSAECWLASFHRLLLSFWNATKWRSMSRRHPSAGCSTVASHLPVLSRDHGDDKSIVDSTRTATQRHRRSVASSYVARWLSRRPLWRAIHSLSCAVGLAFVLIPDTLLASLVEHAPACTHTLVGNDDESLC